MKRILVVGLLITACGGAGAPGDSALSPLSSVSASASAPASATATAKPTAQPTVELSYATDLALIDKQVRAHHPGPFTNHSEDEWKAKLAELADALPAAEDQDHEFVLLGSLVALLDTHSWIEPSQKSRMYTVWLYRFPEGWYVVAAKDESLIGTKLVSINGVSAEDLEARFARFVAHDNQSGLLDGMAGLFSYVEWLHGSGVVDDVDHPNYVFETATGERITPDIDSFDSETFQVHWNIRGGLVGDAPEAVARRSERIWTRLDEDRDLFLVSVNDYGAMIDETNEMREAIESGAADRVVLDMRYLRGGNGDIAIVETLKSNPKINREGALTVLIGRENVSAGTDVAHWLDANTAARFVGEETPARADGYRCECFEIRLPFSHHLVVIPTFVENNGDERDSIPPDVPMALHAEDFFAGRDPVLDAVLNGTI